MARSGVMTVTAEQETQTLAVYAVDIPGNVYLPGAWGTLRYDGVECIVSGGRALFLGQVVGSVHLLEFVSAPGYAFSHWVGLSGDSWVSPIIDSPNSPSTNVTIRSGGPNGIVVYLKRTTSISISVSPTSGNVPFSVSITGTLTDSKGVLLGGATVNLYRDGAFISSVKTIGGNYSFTDTITSVGAYQYQTVFPGTAEHEGCGVHDGTVGEEVPIPLWKLGLVILAVIGGGVGIYYLIKRGGKV